MTRLYCPNCDVDPHPLDWRCMSCGSALELRDLPPFEADAIDSSVWSLWRYAHMLPVQHSFSLGAGMTPLIPAAVDGVQILAKCDYLNPSASYKDRGTETLVNYLVSQHVSHLVEDSSGNAGASLALYAAAAGMNARIFVPASAPEGKRRAIAASAELAVIDGARQAVTDACIAAAVNGTVYATHSWNPYFILGQQTLAWELWEQAGRTAPSAIVMPVGQGGLLLGIARGFRALYAAGLIDRLPRLYGVQPEACDPVVKGYDAAVMDPIPDTVAPSIADGTLVANPVRGQSVLAAIRESHGAAFRVKEALIAPARTALARGGFFVEPTSALAFAAIGDVTADLRENGIAGPPVLILTGHGLKSSAS